MKNKTIEVGDTVRLKKLKKLKIYDGLTCYDSMVTTERLTVKIVIPIDLGKSFRVRLSNGFCYTPSMIDIRTLRKHKPAAELQ